MKISCQVQAMTIPLSSQVQDTSINPRRARFIQTETNPGSHVVWVGINKTVDLNRIHIIQKRYCRLISFSDSRARSAPLFKSLKILNVYNLFRYQASLYMYKHANGSSVATIFGPPANKLFGPLAKELRRILLPGGPLAGPFSPAGPPRSQGLRGPRYATGKWSVAEDIVWVQVELWCSLSLHSTKS